MVDAKLRVFVIIFSNYSQLNIPQHILRQLRDLSCEETAKQLGMNVKRQMMSCPWHTDKKPSLGFKGNHWKCFSCDRGGDAIELVRQLYSLSFIDACSVLCEKFNIRLRDYPSDSIYIPKLKKINKENNLKEKELFDRDVAQAIIDNTSLGLSSTICESLHIHSFELEDTQLRTTLVKQFGLDRLKRCKVVNERGYLNINTPSLIIPYYDSYKHLIGLQTRYLGEQNKNYFIPRFKRICNSNMRIFNMQILSTLVPDSKLFIAEGITDCVAMLTRGFNAIAIPSASSIPTTDLTSLAKYDLYMIPDKDTSGQLAFEKLHRLFLRLDRRLKWIELPSQYKDFAEYHMRNSVK